MRKVKAAWRLLWCQTFISFTIIDNNAMIDTTASDEDFVRYTAAYYQFIKGKSDALKQAKDILDL